MLTEDAAWALLEQHCCPLREATWTSAGCFRLHPWPNTVGDHVSLIVQPREPQWATAEKSLLCGARLRLALRVAQAVSCCRGFSPPTRQDFWRRAIDTLWANPITHIDSDRWELPCGLFAHVGIQWTRQSLIGDAFWTGFLDGTPVCNAGLTTVLDQLQPHMEPDASLVLQVSLSRCISYIKVPAVPSNASPLPLPPTLTVVRVVYPEVLKAILLVALQETAARKYPLRPPPHALPVQLGLVVEYRIDDDESATHELFDLLARAHVNPQKPSLQVTVDRLAIQLAPPIPPRCAGSDVTHRRALATRGRALGELLRALLGPNDAFPHVHTVALMGSSYSDFRLVGAALSGVALAARPLAHLRCSELLDATRPRDNLLRLAWLVFALSCRRRRFPSVPLSLSLLVYHVAVNEQESEFMQQLLASRAPLRDVVREALRLRLSDDAAAVDRVSVRCLRLGSTVRLSRGTRLFFEPFRGDAASVAVAVDAVEDGELDVVARVEYAGHGVWIGVVYAGYGLVWATQSGVTAWYPVEGDEEEDQEEEAEDDEDDDVRMLNDEGDKDGGVGMLSSLAVSFEGGRDGPPALAPEAFCVSAVLPLLRWMAGEALATLSLDRVVVSRADLTRVLALFPRLKALELDRCVVESVDPLLDAYRDPVRRVRIARLSLLGVRDWRVRDVLLVKQVQYLSTLFNWGANGEAPAWMSLLVDAVTSGVGRGVLRDLQLDCRCMWSAQDERIVVESLAQAIVQATLPLQRLHVVCHHKVQCACSQALSALRGAPLKDPPRVRCAVLSVLRVVDCAIPEIARLVLAMAEGTIVRTVTWDSVEHS